MATFVLIRFRENCKYLFVSVLLHVVFLGTVYAQTCISKLEIHLENIKGGFFAKQKVALLDNTGKEVMSAITDLKGVAYIDAACEKMYRIAIANNPEERKIVTPASGAMRQFFIYEANAIEEEKMFAMSPAEIKSLDDFAGLQPDTIFVKGATMTSPGKIMHYVQHTFIVKDLSGLPLKNEQVTFVGQKRHKSVKCTTNPEGKVVVYLLKGDTYSINFKYDSDFSEVKCDYKLGTSTSTLSIAYLGTPEIERRKKEEALRILEEEKRLKELEKRIVAECERLKITKEEYLLRELKSSYSTFGSSEDTVVNAVLRRNSWDNKLIVCDLTGSMSPYAAQLSVWYQLNLKKEKNLQFVFFNGDDLSDNQKKIGQTGGIYYSPVNGLESLQQLMAKVTSKGSGGDCPENNMEALIKGTKMAKGYTHIVSIVDNNAPVKDLALLKTFNQPVHIIVCGASDGYILTDYLTIAWKTKGSIHTIEEDITRIASMSEGEELKIDGITYKIMGGKFVLVKKV